MTSLLEPWSNTDPDYLVQYDFGDYLAVYHRKSGKSHFLNRSAGMVMKAIGQHPVKVETIVQQLRQSFPELAELDETLPDRESSPPSLADFITNLLIRLDELGLMQHNSRCDIEAPSAANPSNQR